MLFIFRFSKYVIFPENWEYKCSIFLKADIIWVSVECWSSYPILLSEILTDEFHCVWNVLNFSNITGVFFFLKHLQFLSTNFSINWNSIKHSLKMLPSISGSFSSVLGHLFYCFSLVLYPFISFPNIKL